MKTLYLDPFSGISGDMFLGLLFDLGLDAEQLCATLKTLPVSGWSIETTRETRLGISGTRAFVHTDQPQPHRRWSDIDAMLAQAPLDEKIRSKARVMFRRLGEAEARVHGTSLEEIHFHEVGAVDAIIDIVGAATGLRLLQIDLVVCAPLPLSHGFVKAAHGRMPLPAPATAELLAGHPICDANSDRELVTPTGAVIATCLASFGPLPDMQLSRTGYGVGGRELTDRPNLLRGFLGETADQGLETDQVVVLESHLDDASPEWLGHLLDLLLEAGALDVGFTALQMKKNRPGTRLTVISEPAQAQSLATLLLHHSSASGVRSSLQRRWKLPRRIAQVDTPWGAVTVKLFYVGERLLRATPEFEDCRALSCRHGIPLPEIYRQVERAADSLFNREEPDDS